MIRNCDVKVSNSVIKVLSLLVKQEIFGRWGTEQEAPIFEKGRELEAYSQKMFFYEVWEKLAEFMRN